jgi:hypothetical protein
MNMNRDFRVETKGRMNYLTESRFAEVSLLGVMAEGELQNRSESGEIHGLPANWKECRRSEGGAAEDRRREGDDGSRHCVGDGRWRPRSAEARHRNGTVKKQTGKKNKKKEEMMKG